MVKKSGVGCIVVAVGSLIRWRIAVVVVVVVVGDLVEVLTAGDVFAALCRRDVLVRLTFVLASLLKI